MKLLITPETLELEFKQAMIQYKEYYWATAWASSSPAALFQQLKINQKRIKRLVVGIHFYQTHPDFIEAFLDNENVHFIEQPDGTFHPKIYLFFNDPKHWKIIMGSANFTHGAFAKNTEASVLITSDDNDSPAIFKSTMKLIRKSWKAGKVFGKESLEKYRGTWRIQRPKIKSLSGHYGTDDKTPKPIYNIGIVNRTWESFMRDVTNDKTHGLGKRLSVMSLARELFSDHKHFSDMSPDERKFIAGLPNKLDKKGAEYWGYFGSMKGANIYGFGNKIEADGNISLALDEIPFQGQITKRHYKNFLKYYKKAFTGNFIATATRLLSMKRPDTFICLDSKNRSALCKDFGIAQSGMDYNRYWDDIIARIYDCEWWQNPNPQNEIEAKVSESRAAFLDSLYYEEK